MNPPDHRVTSFEQAVYDAVSRVPAGRVTSYGLVAKQIGQGNARAVGSALAKNPFAPKVPCHRVVRADGTLGGFYGQTAGPQMAEKERLLRSEGVGFSAQGRVFPEAFTDFSGLALHDLQAPPDE